MYARRNRTTGWPFRNSSIEREDNIAMNQRMVRQLLNRKAAAEQLAAWQITSLNGLGIEVSQSRDENAGLPLKEAAKRGGLDPAFLAIVEAGKALPDEITKDVLKSLSKSVKADAKDLESAMAVRDSGVLERDWAGRFTSMWVSLCSPSFLSQAAAFERLPRVDLTRSNVSLFHDSIWTGYKIESLSPPTLRFFAFGYETEPLQRCNVSVRCGLKEILSGETDEEGRFTFPSGYKGFPENSHMLISRSASDTDPIHPVQP